MVETGPWAGHYFIKSECAATSAKGISAAGGIIIMIYVDGYVHTLIYYVFKFKSSNNWRGLQCPWCWLYNDGLSWPQIKASYNYQCPLNMGLITFITKVFCRSCGPQQNILKLPTPNNPHFNVPTEPAWLAAQAQHGWIKKKKISRTLRRHTQVCSLVCLSRATGAYLNKEKCEGEEAGEEISLQRDEQPLWEVHKSCKHRKRFSVSK